MTLNINHLAIAPILLPLATAAIMVALGERRRTIKAVLGVISTMMTLGIAVSLLLFADSAPAGEPAAISVYLVGNWAAPYGIVLVVDRLSSLMLVLASTVVLAGQLYSIARWHSAGMFFHALVQLLLMGLNGAFLTGDLFNLFVFFEVMLAASYGLVLHGSGAPRVKAGLHYIAVNLAASSLFLIGASLIYGAAGTLNMADLAARVPILPDDERMLMEAGAAILGVAFLVKAGMWPLCFWLPSAYALAVPPVAAIFSIMTKVGIYVILRLWPMVFGVDAGASAFFGGNWLLVGGILTVAFGVIGLLASQDLPRMAAYNVIISSGTLLAAIAAGSSGVTAGALFYLISSTLAVSAFFLLIDLIERGRIPGADVLVVTMEALSEEDEEEPDAADPVGIAIPATMAILGIGFAACALLLAGLPPLTGFVAKFLMLHAMFLPDGVAVGAHEVNGTTPTLGALSWTLMAVLLMSGFAVMVAMARAGVRVFWVPMESTVPKVRFLEVVPIVALLLLCATLTVQAGPVARFMDATAKSIHAPEGYVRGVLDKPRKRPEQPVIDGQPATAPTTTQEVSP
ncbi:monovalent cation/H+ antiporter subunit D [Hyphomicrobium sulfonivorans]|uniref:monovalent cation/H+ antiporter subunit D n=1 Tax=Hyphomicrobium sulfonivorans TaxID=121290 RepID=UPI00156E6DC0|nr:monovalent cation/H+ antiporter subunit D [Hyphomicrobium sulfonivorans]NSL72326.1 monovalent cation/H+ antiporter subunit D [Hyphomicrobium sulfonivorans]